MTPDHSVVPGVAPADATPQFAAEMATAAVNIARQCAHLTDTALGTETPTSADVKRLADQTKTRIPLIDPTVTPPPSNWKGLRRE